MRLPCLNSAAGRVFLPLALSVFLLPVLSPAQSAPTQAGGQPLTAEQLAVYRAVLEDWMQGGWPTVNLAFVTQPLPFDGPSSAQGCAKGIDLEPAAPALVHRFRASDLPQLSNGKVTLVDPGQQRAEVSRNDPGRAIDNGKPVKDSVDNGFAHGLFTLSEIRFSRDRTLAIVSYSFICGSLCGNGGAMVLQKTPAGWRIKTTCSQWVS